MYRKVKTFIRDNQMIEDGMYILAGISGGGDSMAMLSFLKKYQTEKKFRLYVVHVHHGIRGREADRDQKLVERICEKWKIPYKSYFFDVPSLAKEWKTGLEEAGRIVRKKAFEEEKKRLKTENVRVALLITRMISQKRFFIIYAEEAEYVGFPVCVLFPEKLFVLFYV